MINPCNIQYPNANRTMTSPNSPFSTKSNPAVRTRHKMERNVLCSHRSAEFGVSCKSIFEEEKDIKVKIDRTVWP